MDESRPIFVQIAEKIENDILEMRLAEESQVPSTNQFAAIYQINPATAAKGINLLAQEGVLYKKRGIGMFVAEGAREQLLQKRRNQFYTQFVQTMLHEARKLGLTVEQVTEMIKKEGDTYDGNDSGTPAQ